VEQPHCLTRRVGVGTLTLITSLLRNHSGLLATTTTRRYHKKGIHSTHLSPESGGFLGCDNSQRF